MSNNPLLITKPIPLYPPSRREGGSPSFGRIKKRNKGKKEKRG